jgi:hypothetical protein
MKSLHAYLRLMPATFILIFGCDADQLGQKNSTNNQSKRSSNFDVEADKRAVAREGIEKASIPMPEGQYQIDPTAALADEEAARNEAGDRGAFQPMHRDGITLLPANAARPSKGFGLIEDAVAVTRTPIPVPEATTPPSTATPTPSPNPSVSATPGGPDDCPPEPKVCAKACATAHAAAVAVAFAHASVTACAWAEAWACVFRFQPFAKVCSWARSEACSTAFASAFGFGFAFDTETVCKEQCNK